MVLSQHPLDGAGSVLFTNMAGLETETLLAAGREGLRKRYSPDKDPDWNSDLPYGGRVYLARRKKPDPRHIRALEAIVFIATVAFALYAYFYYDNLHFHVTHAYAHLGYASAQHQVGQRYLHGKGVDQHHEKAMTWFRKAADQGHPHAAYNLAIGHLKGMKTDLKQGEAHTLIHKAASQGVKQAHKVLNQVCSRGGC